MVFLTQVYAICMPINFLLYTKSVFNAVNPHDHLSEDEVILKDSVADYGQKSQDAKKRHNRILTNQVENIPAHTAFLAVAYMVNIGSGLANALGYVVMAYTALRTTWFITYSYGINSPVPVRSLSFVLSLLCMLISFILSGVTAFSA